jgi:RNA-splicing ligase RtcB
MKIDRALLSIGTLGGGNHFIELCKDENNSYWLTVHSGSRNLGKQIAEHYQNKAAKEMKSRKTGIARELAYVDGELFENYLHDAKMAQEYATLNRKAMVKVIEKALGVSIEESFSTIHNFIDMTDGKNKILRKGAISAQAGERVLIPLNMRDGSLICVGKGNPDWNFSAPHGAGRLMSRSDAKAKITLPQFEDAMKGIYSTTISRKTIDEAPFAYKPMEEITAYIGDTVDIVSTLRPVYNFKAAE